LFRHSDYLTREEENIPGVKKQKAHPVNQMSFEYVVKIFSKLWI